MRHVNEDLSGQTLTGDYRSHRWIRCKFVGTDFRQADIRNCAFLDCDLTDANLETNLKYVKSQRSEFEGVTLAPTVDLCALRDAEAGIIRTQARIEQAQDRAFLLAMAAFLQANPSSSHSEVWQFVLSRGTGLADRIAVLGRAASSHSFLQGEWEKVQAS